MGIFTQRRAAICCASFVNTILNGNVASKTRASRPTMVLVLPSEVSSVLRKPDEFVYAARRSSVAKCRCYSSVLKVHTD